MIKIILKAVGVLFLGALGALVFEFFALPYFLTSQNFANFQFVKNFKEGKIIVNQTRQVYIQENTALISAIKNAQKSIVAIQKNSAVIGSGLIVTSDGSIVTLASLVPAGSKITIFLNGEAQNYQIIKRDLKSNLALIKVEATNLPTVAFADLGQAPLGQRVFLTGLETARGDSWFADEGIIRSFDSNTVKTNISGKPVVLGTSLFNISGELIGLNFTDKDGRISAISVNTIKSFLGI